MRCYACDGFENKAQYCLRIVKWSKIDISYDIDNKIWREKEINFEQYHKSVHALKRWINQVTQACAFEVNNPRISQVEND